MCNGERRRHRRCTFRLLLEGRHTWGEQYDGFGVKNVRVCGEGSRNLVFEGWGWFVARAAGMSRS